MNSTAEMSNSNVMAQLDMLASNRLWIQIWAVSPAYVGRRLKAANSGNV